MTPTLVTENFCLGGGSASTPQSQSSKTNDLSKSWWMASSFSSFSKSFYRRQFNTHKTAKLAAVRYSGDFWCPSYPSIVKRQWVLAAFASLYCCVLVTTSAAKLLKDQEPEARSWLHDTDSHNEKLCYDRGTVRRACQYRKSLQSMNDLDTHPKLSQLLLLNGSTAYHFLFVDCCFNVFI